jgi:hypothetical protein
MKNKIYRTVWQRIIEQIMPGVTYFIFAMSIILQKGSESRMGIQRDLMVRNKKLTSSILAPNLLEFYKWGVGIGILFCIVIFNFLKRDSEKYLNFTVKNSLGYRYRKYLIHTAGTNALLLIMLIFYNKATWLAYPWMVLSVLIIVIVQYIRLIYIGYNAFKRKE